MCGGVGVDGEVDGQADDNYEIDEEKKGTLLLCFILLRFKINLHRI